LKATIIGVAIMVVCHLNPKNENPHLKLYIVTPTIAATTQTTIY